MVNTTNYFEMLLAAFVIVNGIAFVLFGIDKQNAILKTTRIPEVSLLLFAVLGGWPAEMLAMRVFNHKTKKALFRTGMPIIAVLWTVAVLAILIS